MNSKFIENMYIYKGDDKLDAMNRKIENGCLITITTDGKKTL